MQRLPFIVFVASLLALVSLAAFGLGIYSYQSKNFAYRILQGIKSDLEKLLDPESRDALAEGFLFWHLQPARGQGEGVTINNTPDNGALVMMAGFFDDENQVRLIERDGAIVQKWSLNYLEHFPDPETRPCALDDPLGVDTHGALITPKGELVFNYEYCGTVKLDYCGGVAWTLDRLTHHSVVAREAGGYLILDRESWLADEHPDRAHPFPQIFEGKEILEDYIIWVSENGEITDKLSIPQALLDGGLGAELTVNRSGFESYPRGELQIVHSNKVAELTGALSGAFPSFSKGDLLLSMRDLNLIAVLDGETRQVKWHKTGPWIKQHDPEFRPDGRISVFNNNDPLIGYTKFDKPRLDVPRITNITAINPESGATEVLYGQREGQEMMSVIRGQHEIMPDGGLLIVEFDAGRVLEVDAEGETVWEYVNAYDADRVGKVQDARIYPRDYFSDRPSCN